MTNLEARPREQICSAGGPSGAAVELITPREVPLGGPRAMTVRRTLPSRQRSLIGPFCFADHYGPDDIAATGGMDVAPHPHTGLQTVTWLFNGRVLHQDALHSVQAIQPGQLNLMTAGHGICHSEEGTLARFPQQRLISGVQLWTALPNADRDGEPAFEHVAEVPSFAVDGARVQVFMGSLGGVSSPARAYSPLVAAQLDIPALTTVRLPIEVSFEHGLLVDEGDLSLAGQRLDRAWLGYVAPGSETLELQAGDTAVRAVLLGGTPFPEQILMWWNFVARDHEEVAEAREQWQAALSGDPAGIARFGQVPGYPGAPWPAPELPRVRLKRRGR